MAVGDFRVKDGPTPMIPTILSRFPLSRFLQELAEENNSFVHPQVLQENATAISSIMDIPITQFSQWNRTSFLPHICSSNAFYSVAKFDFKDVKITGNVEVIRKALA
ncbi:hypothetical protein MIMGU_mgv1a016818mg [Erythranthe guttata]|uniref:Uncharacterized protein n=1 Tax=Erythranthe guttata TaxID=4155 RepID=A0A022Q7F7_ERYGU|nr:hypothetical protein MIMGU_mgv1a016818mg [Erythranthe guttata]